MPIGTIIKHLEKLFLVGKLSKADLFKNIDPKLVGELSIIHQAFLELGDDRLSPVFEKFHGKYSYDQLRLARLMMYTPSLPEPELGDSCS